MITHSKGLDHLEHPVDHSGSCNFSDFMSAQMSDDVRIMTVWVELHLHAKRRFEFVQLVVDVDLVFSSEVVDLIPRGYIVAVKCLSSSAFKWLILIGSALYGF